MEILFRSVINETISKMEEEGIDDAVTDAWLLAEFELGITRQKYYMNMQMVISQSEYDRYIKLVDKRCSHIPLQHITGSQEFMGLNFKVNENVLIPRQDTELLVEKAIEVIRKYNGTVKVLDMCTGSGCIAVSIAKLCKNAKVTAVDISEKALTIAKENAAINEVEINFVHSDLFANVKGKYDLIVSNPPYIPTKIIETLETEVKEHEPVLALDGNEDGLEFYEKISQKAFDYLSKGGYLLYEIGYDQGESVSSILRKKVSCVKVYKDLAENDRVVIAGKEEL